jgi:hypothetical protein
MYKLSRVNLKEFEELLPFVKEPLQNALNSLPAAEKDFLTSFNTDSFYKACSSTFEKQSENLYVIFNQIRRDGIDVAQCQNLYNLSHEEISLKQFTTTFPFSKTLLQSAVDLSESIQNASATSTEWNKNSSFLRKKLNSDHTKNIVLKDLQRFINNSSPQTAKRVQQLDRSLKINDDETDT